MTLIKNAGWCDCMTAAYSWEDVGHLGALIGVTIKQMTIQAVNKQSDR